MNSNEKTALPILNPAGDVVGWVFASRTYVNLLGTTIYVAENGAFLDASEIRAAGTDGKVPVYSTENAALDRDHGDSVAYSIFNSNV